MQKVKDFSSKIGKRPDSEQSTTNTIFESISNNKYLPYLVIAVYVFLSLSPMLTSGYYSDDLMNSEIKGQIGLQHSTLIKYIYTAINQWIKLGRFFPIGLIVTYTVAYFSYNLIFYKLFLVMLVLTNVILLGILMSKICKDRNVSFLAMLLLPILFQFRLYHDPITSFDGMLQVFMFFMLASLIFFTYYIDNGRTINITASVLLYSLTLFMYEISIPLILLFVSMVLTSDKNIRGRKSLRILAPHILSALISFGIMLFFRQIKPPMTAGYSGIKINFDATKIISTFAIQTFSSMPLSYYLCDPSHLFQYAKGTFLQNIQFCDLSTLLLFLAGYWRATHKVTNNNKTNIFFFFGVILTLSPAILIALSAKYQEELISSGLGMGYLPVYIQYFGIALTITGLIQTLIRKTSATKICLILRLVSSAVISALLLLNIQNNRLVVDKSNIDLHYRRAALVKALKENILSNVPDDSRLIISDKYSYDPYPLVKSTKGWVGEKGYPWKNESFIYLYSGRKMKVMGTSDEVIKAFNLSQNTHNSETNVYILEILSSPEQAGIKTGFVVLSRITGLRIDSAGRLCYEARPEQTNSLETM